MKDLKTYYHDLFEESAKAFLAGNYLIDHQIGSPSDNRFGLTLIIRANDQIKSNINNFIDELKSVEPHQYYYPDSDIHITVMSIISCYDGFKPENIAVTDYNMLIEKSLADINAFEINFQGVTASGSAIMIQGFPAGDSLCNLRNNLRMNFKESGLEESIDKRYSIITAHITVVRFREKFKDTHQLITLLKKNRLHSFGKLKVKTFDLVFNDWYHREKNVKHLHRFTIK